MRGSLRLWLTSLCGVVYWSLISGVLSELQVELRPSSQRNAAIMVVASSCLLGVALGVARRVFRAEPTNAGAKAQVCVSLALVVSALAGAALVFPLAFVLDEAAHMLELAGVCSECPRYRLRAAPLSELQATLLFSFAVILSPIAEEVFFRGILFKKLRTLSSDPACVCASAAAFALCHPSLQGRVQAVVLGVLLGSLRVKYGGIASAIAAHAGFNLQLALMSRLFPIGVESNLPERAADLPTSWLVVSVLSLCAASAFLTQRRAVELRCKLGERA